MGKGQYNKGYQPSNGDMFDGNGNIINMLDLLQIGDVTVQSTTDKAIEDGRLYVASYQFSSVANAAKVYFSVTVGSVAIKAVSAIAQSTGSATAKIYRGAVITGGTIAPTYNRNTTSANTAQTVVKGSPTVTTLGTQVFVDLIAGGAGGGSRVGGVSDQSQDAILAPNTTTLFEIENTSGQSSTIVCQFYFIEPMV